MPPRAAGAAAAAASIQATPVERVAGLAFFAFTVLQVPFLLLESDLAAGGLVQLSPLQITAASLARGHPGAALYIQDVLTPGAWVRESLSPYLRCTLVPVDAKKGSEAAAAAAKLCDAVKRRLLDVGYVRNGTNLPLLMALLEGGGLGAGHTALVYGSAMIVVAALCSLRYSVKTAVLGFALFGYGVYQSGHIALPPAVLVAFLCIYAGFNLGEVRGGGAKAVSAADARRQAGLRSGGGGAAAGPTPQQPRSGVAAGGGVGGAGSSKKQKQGRRKA